ncbi:MAG: hypothetical protein ACK494_03705, partial [Planctomycetota bacterium]
MNAALRCGNDAIKSLRLIHQTHGYLPAPYSAQHEMKQTKKQFAKNGAAFSTHWILPKRWRKNNEPSHKDRQMNPEAISEKIHPRKKGSLEISKSHNF